MSSGNVPVITVLVPVTKAVVATVGVHRRELRLRRVALSEINGAGSDVIDAERSTERWTSTAHYLVGRDGSNPQCLLALQSRISPQARRCATATDELFDQARAVARQRYVFERSRAERTDLRRGEPAVLALRPGGATQIENHKVHEIRELTIR
jgi:hypothetical protein